MAITVNNKISTLLKKNKILVIDDINSANKEEVFDIITKCNLYVNSKFSVPTTYNEIINKDSRTISTMNKLFTELNSAINNKKSTLFTNDTQLRNFKAKLLHWCNNDFSNVVEKLDRQEDVTIVVNNEMSKHEKIFIRVLADCGATILVISKDFNNDVINQAIGVYSEELKSEVQVIKFNTNENIDYKTDKLSCNLIKDEEKCVYSIKDETQYNNIDEIETALYLDNKIVKVIVSGMENYMDTCNFYAKLYKTCMNDTNWVLANNGFTKPTYEQTSSIPRFSNDKHDYILHTVLKFLKLGSENNNYKVSEIIKEKFNHGSNKDLSGDILYNKLVYMVCSLNTLYSTGKPECIVFYGIARKNDVDLLDILSKIDDISVVVACSDKSKVGKINGLELLDLPISADLFPIPLIDRRDGVHTMAAQAEKRVQQTLFSGDTLGMYKPGQFRTCRSIDFNTTYDEIKLWWNKELYIRPGFEVQGDLAVIPTMFRVIKGCIGTSTMFENEIQKYCCGKTLLCRDITELDMLSEAGIHCNIHRGTDVNCTRFENQKPFFENGKINKERIKSGRNYTYSFLAMNKQDMILDKIEDIIVNDKVNKGLFRTEQEFIDAVLNVGLNLNIAVLQNIQWFEFYTYNPNLILILKDQNMPDINNMILLALLQNLGFDVLIFVPTSYSSIESLVGPKCVYNTNIVGEANYEVDTSRLHVTSNIEINEVNTVEKYKRQGFFSKIFGK